MLTWKTRFHEPNTESTSIKMNKHLNKISLLQCSHWCYWFNYSKQQKEPPDSVSAYPSKNSTEYIVSSNLILAQCNVSKNLITVYFLLTAFIMLTCYLWRDLHAWYWQVGSVCIYRSYTTFVFGLYGIIGVIFMCWNAWEGVMSMAWNEE